MILINLNKALLIYKAPPDTDPYLQTGIRVSHSRKIVIGPSKAAIRTYFGGIQVFGSYKCFEAPDPELKKGRNIGSIADCHGVLVKKLSEDRRIAVGFIWSLVLYFKASGYIEVFEKTSLVGDTIPVNSGGTCKGTSPVFC
jgi:hypothetical protein